MSTKIKTAASPKRLSEKELARLAAKDAEVRSAQGHADHFLSRLERAEGAAGELALFFYHTPTALRFVLSWVNVPEGCDRVALSLAPGDEGPFLVASREGKFVTCLGPGMALTGLFLINHERLLALVERHDEISRSRGYFSRLGSEERLRPIMMRIFEAGIHYSQEDFDDLAPAQPVLLGIILHSIGRNTRTVLDLKKVLAQCKHLRNVEEAALRKFFGALHACGHFFALLGSNGHRGLEHSLREEPVLDVLERSLTLAWLSDNSALVLKGLWLMGVLGKFLDPLFERWMRGTEISGMLFLGIMAKIVTALRRNASEAERIDLNRRLRKYVEHLDVAKLKRFGWYGSEMFWECLDHALLVPDAFHSRVALPLMRRRVFELLTGDGTTVHPTFERAEDIPEAIAMTMPIVKFGGFLNNPEPMHELVVMLPHLSRVPARELYLPRSFLAENVPPWRREDAEVIIETDRNHWIVPTHHNPTKDVGRNDPCPCGSGTKFKRCCLK